jgi:hypothetical protein
MDGDGSMVEMANRRKPDLEDGRKAGCQIKVVGCARVKRMCPFFLFLTKI